MTQWATRQDTADALLARFSTHEEAPARPKILSAEEAVKLIEPGSLIHLAATHSLPIALTFELTRHFWGRKPRFQLVTLGAALNVQVMLRDPGFLTRIVTSYAGNVYPAPAPARVFQENYKSGAVPVENWSLCTLVLRLLAGAMRVPFLPTNSLRGSSLERENIGMSVAHIDDPFSSEEQVVVRALVPDYTLVHGWAADPAGNVLARLPLTEANYGALAARRGVIASVDRIVSSSFIREHPEDLLVPASKVLAIVKLPYGAHPSPCRGFPPEWGYAEDDQFLLEFRDVSRDLAQLDAWIRRWVLEADHSHYLKQLGEQRLKSLVERAAPQAWRREAQQRIKEIDFDAPPTPVEQMVVAMAQICVDRVRARGYRTILAGQGTSNLAAWLAYYLLAEEGIEVDLMAEIGLFGYAPRPPQPLIFNFANIATCKGLGSALDVLGIQVAGAGSERCIGMLGAAVIDQYGNVDSTCVPDLKLWLLGSGGANDVLSSAAEVLVCCPQDIRRLWRQVPYITGPGHQVTTLVTTMAVFRKPGPDQPFRLEGVIPPPDKPDCPTETLIKRIQQTTGWNVESAPRISRLPLPDPDILRILRLFDPDRHYLRR